VTTLATSLRHDSFTLTRHFEAAPAAVWQLFADEATWRRWFKMPGSAATYTHDFRVGGGDTASAEFRMPDGRVESLENRATYLAIDADRRLTYAYVAIVDGIPRWSALVTVELADDGDGTLLSWTEQVAVLHASDGSGDQDLAHLRGGVRLRFNAMTVALRGTP
jgi:uncharacterized protein YndB with AHSA1/START domain